MFAQETLSVMALLVTVCVALWLGPRLVRRLVELALPDSPARARKRQPVRARGVGPCGVARITYPWRHGLDVTELR